MVVTPGIPRKTGEGCCRPGIQVKMTEKTAHSGGFVHEKAALKKGGLYFFTAKSRVMVLTEGLSWVSFTPAAFSIRLEARVAGVSAYLSER